jgi:succinate dehydrogenase / fumarate reductase, cytochrome b subunit
MSGRARPLSPHLQVYKWGPHMLVSILHRFTGVALAIGGMGILAWWLLALASGPAAFETFRAVAASWFGQLVLFGLTWVFFHHLMGGVRHLYMDTGAGYGLKENRTISIGSIVASVALTLITWVVVWGVM